MNYIIITLLVLGFVFFLRGIFIARGKLKEKLFPKEGFLFWQKVTAFIYLAAIILGIIIKLWPFAIIAAINELLNFLFYLQPTPRISKIILYLLLVVNVGFIFYVIFV